MELNDEEQKICDEACKHIKSNKDGLIDRFVIQKNPLKFGFITIFMAGSPGAGKTEFSKRYIPLLFDKKDEKVVKYFREKGIDLVSVDTLLVRIDVDEIREFLPQYTKTNVETGMKGNAQVIQRAANNGLDILRDYCFSNSVSFIHSIFQSSNVP